ncbi:hypothetical protein B9Z55_009402 [Caenorhabditis nigoni]|uniref:G-protein coupled receptors family 1 profile domain-containing protein n=1 Tax=Caenorhabditis nigoni TaxID=1611254 RepID=A0A2G5URZ9_9PELO|nr:hypothetical protein B9Z55_009402 [Caenorhabditis nigoni]
MTSDDIFENCTHRFPIEHVYKNCTNTTNQCELIQNLYSARMVFHWLNLYLSTFCFVVSAILNIYCLFTTVYIFHNLSDEIRKHYVFVLSRFLSSIFAVVSLLTMEKVLYLETSPVSFTFYAIGFSVYNFSMDSLLLSYIMISLITYFGVVHPGFYRNNITLRSLYITLGFIWIGSLSIAIPLSLYQSAINAPGPIECDLHYCAKVVEWITFSFVCLALSLTILLTAFVLVSLYWYHFKAKKNGIEIPKVTARARIRLTWTFFALIVFSIVELFPEGIVIVSDQYDLNTCESFYAADKLLVQTIVNSLETFMGSVVFMADPIMNIFFDKNISQTVKLQLTWIKKKLSMSPPKK